MGKFFKKKLKRKKRPKERKIAKGNIHILKKDLIEKVFEIVRPKRENTI